MAPLDGIRIIDLSRVVSGPFCTMTLGDMGADIIKIEEPGRGDESRAFGPPFLNGESPYFLSVNRNKKSCTLNLKSDEGLAIFHRLVRTADVVIENFRPGAMERLGLDYPQLSSIYPRLIYCSISGFGDSGQDAERPGYDLIVQGESGLMELTGHADGPPTRVGTSIADLTSALMAAQGILLALYARQTTNRGQHVRVAMLDALVSLLTFNTGNYFATGQNPTRTGNEHPSVVPYQTFKASDGWINLAIANDKLWARYCEAIDRIDLRDNPLFSTAPSRVANRNDLIPIITAIMLLKTVNEWITLLASAGVPCGRIRTVEEVCANPQLIERNKVVVQQHPTIDSLKMIGLPIELSETPGRINRPPPLLGEQTNIVLKDAGYTDAEVQNFRARGIV